MSKKNPAAPIATPAVDDKRLEDLRSWVALSADERRARFEQLATHPTIAQFLESLSAKGRSIFRGLVAIGDGVALQHVVDLQVTPDEFAEWNHLSALPLEDIAAWPPSQRARFAELHERVERFTRAAHFVPSKAPTRDRPTDARALPSKVAQPTFPEAKRLARGLALGPSGIGWEDVLGSFALVHTENGAQHNLRLEGALIPEWWGRPRDNASLRRELVDTGHDGIALLFNSLALVLLSEKTFVDVEIDELISRIGKDPRSVVERAEERLKVWRILTILSAARVIGSRSAVVRDRVSGRTVHLESDDALLEASAFRERGSQVSFDAGVAPLKVTLSAKPWLARWRGDRTVLQDFGDLLAITSIPIGKPSGAWARAIALALTQAWREQATRATYGRAGDEHRLTARFRAFTRRELLEAFPPQPSVIDVLGDRNPGRAIEYWESAISDLKAQPKDLSRRPIVGYYGPTRDWENDRPRKGWAELWLDEPLDIRPPVEGAETLGKIASKAKAKRRRPEGTE